MTTTIVLGGIGYLVIILLILGIVRGGALREQPHDREDEQP